jgi:hypothetical protein
MRKRLVSLVFLPCTAVAVLALGCDDPPTAPATTSGDGSNVAVAAAPAGPGGAPAWVRAFATIGVVPGEEYLGPRVMYGHNVVGAERTGPPGDYCVYLDPSIEWQPEFAGASLAVIVTAQPFFSVGYDLVHDGEGKPCVHVVATNRDMPFPVDTWFSIVVF